MRLSYPHPLLDEVGMLKVSAALPQIYIAKSNQTFHSSNNMRNRVHQSKLGRGVVSLKLPFVLKWSSLGCTRGVESAAKLWSSFVSQTRGASVLSSSKIDIT